MTDALKDMMDTAIILFNPFPRPPSLLPLFLPPLFLTTMRYEMGVPPVAQAIAIQETGMRPCPCWPTFRVAHSHSLHSSREGKRGKGKGGGV